MLELKNVIVSHKITSCRKLYAVSGTGVPRLVLTLISVDPVPCYNFMTRAIMSPKLY